MQDTVIHRGKTEIVQLNLGAKCNQMCRHCHVDAGPNRTEAMDTAVIDRVFSLIERTPGIRAIDLTGGAPELHPLFRSVVKRACSLGLEVIDRCNLSVLLEDGQELTAIFLAEHSVHIIASLPCYTMENVDAQRGQAVFARSIKVLKTLNGLGYGREDPSAESSGLILDLVYNPGGAFLPGNQAELDRDYHARLRAEYGISFNKLIAITNVPIARFRSDLELQGSYGSYIELLRLNFNPDALDSLMCKSLVSIGWTGEIYDCDFNQALRLKESLSRTVFDIRSFDDLEGSRICLSTHCFACTAGAGSSCFGAVTGEASKIEPAQVGEAAR